MKTLSLVLLSLSISSAFARPHMDLDMTGREYLALLNKIPKRNLKSLQTPEQEEIERYLSYGKRNLQWVEFVNAFRTPEKKIALSSPATQPGNGINTPKMYNFRTIKQQWDILLKLLPKSLKRVVIDGEQFTTNIGVTDREFQEWLFQLDGAYQITARYKMMLPYKDDMAKLVAYDVRGYYNLIQEENLDSMLTNFASLNDMQKSRLTRNLRGICMNGGISREDCNQQMSDAIANNTLVDFKDVYLPAGKTNYDSFFNILGARPDGIWTSANPNLMTIPFKDPKDDKILDFLKTNIEDEWKWDGWQLVLNFVDSDDETMTRVEFEPGATPHVESAPGHIITMDQNSLLSEYDVKWTIRHEYGHVLGFPDCYHEFYDEEQEAFVSYQLDVTNLMCSRRGHLQQIHFDELKKAYFKE